MGIIDKEFLSLLGNYPFYSQEKASDPLVVVKLFDIAGTATWYLTEYDPETKTAFGYVTGLNTDEWGYVHLPELEELKHFGIPRIERDLYFVQKPIGELVSSFKKEEEPKPSSTI